MEYGYNDNSVIVGGTKTKEYFIESYTALINVLRGKYSGVPIVCIIPFKQSLAEEIRGIAMNFSFCYVVETSGYDVTVFRSSIRTVGLFVLRSTYNIFKKYSGKHSF